MLGPLIAAFATGEAGLAIERTKRAALAYAFALLLGLLGASFLLIAAFIFAARELGPLAAALIFAGVFIALAVVVLVVHRIRAGIEQRRIAQKRKTDLFSLGATAAVAAIPTLMSGRRGRATGAAAIATPLALTLAYALYRRRRTADETEL